MQFTRLGRIHYKTFKEESTKAEWERLLLLIDSRAPYGSWTDHAIDCRATLIIYVNAEGKLKLGIWAISITGKANALVIAEPLQLQTIILKHLSLG